MRNISSILLALRKKALGNFRAALMDGMTAGKDIRVMGGVGFGSEPYLITLGDHITLSFDVRFITHDGGTWAFRDLKGYKDVHRFGRIRIGSHTFIGARAIILPGVTIGKRCVIGAGSVVTKDVPDGTVVAGVPAGVIATTAEYAEKLRGKNNGFDVAAYEKDKKAYLLRWCK